MKQPQTLLTFNWKQLKLSAFCSLFLALFLAVTVSAQNFMVQPGLNGLSFADGNLFNVQFLPGTGNEPITMNAQLSLNGKVIATQTGVASPSTNSVQSLNGGLSDQLQGLAKLGILPVGRYSLCISAQGVEAKCQTFVITAQSNAAHLNLISPAKGAIFEHPYPLLSWISSFQALTTGVSFRLVVTEASDLKRGSLFQNRAVPSMLDLDGIQETNKTYPVEAPALQSGVKYLWGVEAYAGGELLAQSDVWDFSIKPTVELNELPISLSYIDISRINNLPSYYILGALKLRYTPRGNSETAEITITDENGKQKKLKENTIQFASNDPYVSYDLTEMAGLKHLKKYTVELKLESGTTKRFFVTYVNPAFYKP